MASTFQDGGVMVHAQPGAQLFQVISPSAEASDQVTAAFTVSSASAALPTTARVFRFHADQACFITFGTGSATATTADIPFDAGTEIMGVPEPYTHVAAIRNTTDGTLTVTAMG
jgi:hypothetical protein